MKQAALSCLGATDLDAQLAAEFAIIWDLYPKRVREMESLECYRARRMEGVPFRTLYVAVLGYKRDRKGEEAKFTMHADAFFGTHHRYKDYDGKANGQTSERGDGQWTAPMKTDLQALAKRQEEEDLKRQRTGSVEDRMKNL